MQRMIISSSIRCATRVTYTRVNNGSEPFMSLADSRRYISDHLIKWKPHSDLLDYARALIAEGDMQFKGGDDVDALEKYEKAYKMMMEMPHSYGNCDDEMSTLMNHIGVIHFKQGDIDGAIKNFKMGLEFGKGTDSGKITSHRAMLLKNLAEAYREKGLLDDSLKYYSESIDLFKMLPKTEKEKDESFPDVLSGAGLYYHRRNKLVEKPMECEVEVTDVDHFKDGRSQETHDGSDVADTLHSMGHVYYRRGDYDKALNLFNEALTLKVSVLGKNDLSVAKSMFCIGKIHFLRGDIDKAMDVFQVTLGIQRRLLGDDSVEVAESIRNIGRIEEKLRNYDTALNLYLEAKRILELQHGPEHIDLSPVLTNIGNIFAKERQFEDALSTYKRALAIKEKDFGPDHPDTVDTMSNMGVVYYHQGFFSEAIHLFDEVLRIQKIFQGDEHPEVAITLNNLGDVYRAQEKYEEALRYYKAALRIQKNKLDSDHAQMSKTVHSIGLLSSELGKWNEAADCFEEAMKVMQNRLGDSHSSVLDLWKKFGEINQEKGNLKQAAKMYKEALRIQEVTLGSDHVDCADTINNIGCVLTQLKQHDLSLEFFQKALSIYLAANDGNESHPDVIQVKKNIDMVTGRKCSGS